MIWVNYTAFASPGPLPMVNEEGRWLLAGIRTPVFANIVMLTAYNESATFSKEDKQFRS